MFSGRIGRAGETFGMTSLTQSKWLFVFFFNDTATTEIYTLSLHDALPILAKNGRIEGFLTRGGVMRLLQTRLALEIDRKSTRLNSSHLGISYAVFCLKKKKNQWHRTAAHQAWELSDEDTSVPTPLRACPSP